jgi:hypothetical protein
MRTCAECGAEESKTTSKVSAESNLIMFANDVAELLDCTTGEFASIDEISTYNIKQAALVGVHWERKSDPNWDTMEFTYKVSDLNNFTKRYFGRSCDWTNTEDTWPGAVYDPATNTLKVNFLAAGGGEEKDFQTVRDHGDGTYTVAEENDSWSLELVVKKTGNGYTLISYQRH